MRVQYLIIGGGGSGVAGGAYGNAGNGGGGGFLEGEIEIVGKQNIIVGGGGIGNFGGANGADSSFAGLVAFGGGAGGANGVQAPAGGCGGGGGGNNGTNTPWGTGGIGSQGGNGGDGDSSPYATGGGGGAGGNGADYASGAMGGIGKASSISGISVLYGVGGSPIGVAQPTGSNYGRGSGNSNYPDRVLAGGDGIVILSVPKGTIVGAKGGVHTQANGNDIWTFTASGIWTPVALSPFISRIII